MTTLKRVTDAYKLIYPESYIRRARKFLRQHPEMLMQYRKILEFLELNPFHPSLRPHRLKGRMSGLSSVSINISYRTVIELIIEGDKILLVNTGKHHQVC